MLHAKYQPNWHSGSAEEVNLTFFTIYGHGGHLEIQIITHDSLILYIYHINAKYEISLKYSKGSCIRNFASFFPILPHALEACLGSDRNNFSYFI